ncbi:beta-galactosidase subunit beta [Jinshanibacter sp. LJY008]|uniref:Beta-galactosidase subunit beta n=1 Tax=Limnobaculum eriocheiris TaxID=2897391 RepID=A0A9X1SKQ2_9GAMM|nr:beta-galactosidase subunit beta [Limnobaculum eriocheiris]MCD1126723.1 beta-galactosidase subunit beta [Limnobaculum eriocheiris]
MIVLHDLALFKQLYHQGRKWQRCIEAINHVPNIQPDIFYSIGDSLIYRLQEGGNVSGSEFIGYRRYLNVHYYLEGGEKVEIADKQRLQQVKAYDNCTDREYLIGKGSIVELKQGEVAIFENHEACRLLGPLAAKKLILQVTVEGGYFKNK